MSRWLYVLRRLPLPTWQAFRQAAVRDGLYRELGLWVLSALQWGEPVLLALPRGRRLMVVGKWGVQRLVVGLSPTAAQALAERVSLRTLAVSSQPSLPSYVAVGPVQAVYAVEQPLADLAQALLRLVEERGPIGPVWVGGAVRFQPATWLAAPPYQGFDFWQIGRADLSPSPAPFGVLWIVAPGASPRRQRRRRTPGQGGPSKPTLRRPGHPGRSRYPSLT